MNARIWFAGASLLVMGVCSAREGETPDYRTIASAACPQDAVDMHVREELAYYGPRSTDHEFFAFVYILDGNIGSAVIQGRTCANSYSCSIDTARAVPLIPNGAKVLGEWHSHPRSNKARSLSIEDVRGARNNRHIRCYAAYYSQPDGEIYSWNPSLDSVPSAMSSLVLIGRYRHETAQPTQFAISADPDSAAIIAAQENPGSQCLSTNTSVHTAATTKKSCRRSLTSRSPSAPAAERRGSRSSCPPPCSG